MSIYACIYAYEMLSTVDNTDEFSNEIVEREEEEEELDLLGVYIYINIRIDLKKLVGGHNIH
jgi:hypothetical protein